MSYLLNAVRRWISRPSCQSSRQCNYADDYYHDQYCAGECEMDGDRL